jgi:hypothetical protein
LLRMPAKLWGRIGWQPPPLAEMHQHALYRSDLWMPVRRAGAGGTEGVWSVMEEETR